MTDHVSANVEASHTLPRGFGLSKKIRHSAALGLVVVLIALPGFALWGTVSTYRAGSAAWHASMLSDALAEARYAVGAEESLERKYRLEPVPEVRARHLAAGEVMLGALLRARVLADTPQQALIDDVVTAHKGYLVAIDHMFAAVDAGDTTRSNEIDEHEVDPTFDQIESNVVALATDRRAETMRNLAGLAELQARVTIATPVVFALGLGLIAFFWSVLRSYEADARTAAAREAGATLRSERRFRAMVQHSSDVVLVCAPGGQITYQSPAAEASWGYAPDALLDRLLSSIVEPEDKPAARELWEQLLNEPGTMRQTELRLIDASGRPRYVELLVTNLCHESDIGGVVVTTHCIDERKDFERQLTQQAFFDALTDLPNRALFRDRLDRALVRTERRHTTVGLLFLDLDNFKLVNDSLGHQLGDELLVAAARRLRECVRAEDTVARLGGDEFVILLEHLNSEADVLPILQAVSAQFERPFVLDGRQVVISASVGVALADASGENADSLLRNADLAMYRAKSAGKGQHVFFEPGMHTDTLARLELEADLRHAVEREELRIEYQPIVPLRSGRVLEVEALVRWDHPTRGLVQPLDFIPIAEETGLIVPIGMWVLAEACRQGVEWRRRFPDNPPIVVGVNLSPRQFQMPDLAGEVAQILEQTGLEPRCLKLEITEGTIMRDVEATITTLNKLKASGIQIAIDDFGTGYSSLAYLKRLPLDVLKIDRSFVKGIGNNAEDKAIVQAIISLAKSLGLSVTAEGIETGEQAAALDSWSCDRGQGYHFAKPMSAEALERLLDTNVVHAPGPFALVA